jgi:magnesium and cobalt transporter
MLGADFSDDEFDTVGGLVMQQIGHMPRPGETTELGGFRFKVLSAEKRRIHLLQVRRIDSATDDDAVLTGN